MKVLVTGAAGFSGLHLLKKLQQHEDWKQAEILAADLPGAFAKREDLARAIGVDPGKKNLRLLPMDLCRPETLGPLRTEKPDIIFHAASLYDYSASAEKLHRINVDGTENLLTAISANPPQRLMHWSTCGVFGKPIASGKHRNLPFSEISPSPRNHPDADEPPNGLVNAYSASKWKQEQLIWRSAENLNITVIRPAPIYGPGSDYGHGGIIRTIASGWLPVIPEDAWNAINASVHVEDLARFALHVARLPQAIGEDYNVADGGAVSYAEFLHTIALLTGKKMAELPIVPLEGVRMLAENLAALQEWLVRSFSLPRWKMLETQSAVYIGSSYWISNRKSLDTGFTYRYADVREGLKDTITWFRSQNWI